jgi:coatomer subunit beta
VVEIFTFDIVIEFFIKNTSKYDYQNVTIDLFAPTNLDIIEKAPQISLSANESKTLRSCIKFSSTCNSYIFGQVTYSNTKGVLTSLNLSGIFIDLLNTYPADISESQFRKCWTEYNWEHNVILISKKNLFSEIVEPLIQELNLKLVNPAEISLIDEESLFLVCNLYTKSKLGEDALVNVSIEKTLDKRVIGTAIIRSKVKVRRR